MRELFLGGDGDGFGKCVCKIFLGPWHGEQSKKSFHILSWDLRIVCFPESVNGQLIANPQLRYGYMDRYG